MHSTEIVKVCNVWQYYGPVVSQVYVGMEVNSDLHVTQLLSNCDWSKQH